MAVPCVVVSPVLSTLTRGRCSHCLQNSLTCCKSVPKCDLVKAHHDHLLKLQPAPPPHPCHRGHNPCFSPYSITRYSVLNAYFLLLPLPLEC